MGLICAFYADKQVQGEESFRSAQTLDEPLEIRGYFILRCHAIAA
jgi:hypothetical protein